MTWVRFESIYKKRVWGGNNLSKLFKENFPVNLPIGESWEIVDRENDQSLAIWEGYKISLQKLLLLGREYLMGPNWEPKKKFPLLIKLLDCAQTLSVQVHPPEDIAQIFFGESKNEYWYILEAIPGAKIYAGLKRGTTEKDFEIALSEGNVSNCLHSIDVSKGQSIFIPAGRIHAIGAGVVILEIQDNSDTTYRVFDWNRLGLDGKPRDLHIAQSLCSINFQDFEPQIIPANFSGVVADCENFCISKFNISRKEPFFLKENVCAKILHVVEGELKDKFNREIVFSGESVFLPYSESFELMPGSKEESKILITEIK